MDTEILQETIKELEKKIKDMENIIEYLKSEIKDVYDERSDIQREYIAFIRKVLDYNKTNGNVYENRLGQEASIESNIATEAR